MAVNAIFKPGASHGFYPQNVTPVPGALELWLSSWVAKLPSLQRARQYRLTHIVKKIDAAAAGLAAATDSELQERLQAVRDRLQCDGLQPLPVFASFALLREFSARVLNMRHFDVQLFGAWAMINGNMAEMATGEGKSLTATLAAGSAALAGIPVHVITTNEYLATRDAAEMQPLYAALGLRVSAITEDMQDDAKRSAYQSDVVYCTNKQIAFDYLRDRIQMGNESGRTIVQFNAEQAASKPLLRGLCFAIIDEADSVLIDEARTPLIITREHKDPQQQLIYQQALVFAQALREGRDYTVQQREHRVLLSTTGCAWLEQKTEAMQGLWQGARRRQFLVQQALVALHLYQRDKHYLLREDKVQIIDQNTGRVMADRSWEQGLQQMIETKEGCELSGQRETLARISYQRFFRRYLRLAGMSGTLQEVEDELWTIYRQRVVSVPRNKASRLTTTPNLVYRRASDKWLAIIERVKVIHASGRPLLIGTRSVADSELLSEVLSQHDLSHRVLNARQDHAEAEIVATAGQRGSISVATNMAGRGTDIKLGAGVDELGGLAVIAAERNDSQRVDRQLSGRAGRQGDSGSFEAILSLSDTLLHDYYPLWLRRILGHCCHASKPLPKLLSRILLYLPQQSLQRQYRALRKDLLKMDEHTGSLLAFSGRQE